MEASAKLSNVLNGPRTPEIRCSRNAPSSPTWTVCLADTFWLSCCCLNRHVSIPFQLPHNDMYQLVGTSGFLQSPRPREVLQAVPVPGGGWQTIKDYTQSDGLKEQWERCKKHQPGDKGFKMIAPGTMVREQAKHMNSG